MNGIVKVPFLKVIQSQTLFYVCVLENEVLLKVCHTKKDDFDKNDILYQRKLDFRRLSQINDYMTKVQGLLPTAVVLNSEQPIIVEDNLLKIDLENDKFFIIDGQHRIFGCANISPSVPLVVVLMEQLDIDKQSELFLTINNEQKKVDSTVRFNMMVHDRVKTPEKIVREMALMFNSDDDSPFYNMIRFTDEYAKKGEIKISLASFAEPIVNYIYKSRDHYLIKRVLETSGCFETLKNYNGPQYPNKILWNLYVNDKEDTIYRILFNYFKAMKKVFEQSWGNPYYITNKTTGYNALILLFRDIYCICLKDNNFSTSHLFSLLKELTSIENNFTLSNYSLGKVGSYELYKTMKKTIGIDELGTAVNMDYSLLDVIVDDDSDYE